MKKSIREALENLEVTIVDLEKGLEMGKDVLTSTPYIVTIGGLSVDPVIEDRKTTGKFKFALPCNSRRFTKRDAEIIAQVTVNGNGVCGLARPWVEVTENLLASLKRTMKMIKDSEKK